MSCLRYDVTLETDEFCFWNEWLTGSVFTLSATLAFLPFSFPRPHCSSSLAQPSVALATRSVGDITPVEGVSREIKQQLEHEAMQAFLSEMLGGEGCREARERIWGLWEVRIVATVFEAYKPTGLHLHETQAADKASRGLYVSFRFMLARQSFSRISKRPPPPPPQEYEERETPEAKLVKDLDRLELILQAVEYERCESSSSRSCCSYSAGSGAE